MAGENNFVRISDCSYSGGGGGGGGILLFVVPELTKEIFTALGALGLGICCLWASSLISETAKNRKGPFAMQSTIESTLPGIAQGYEKYKCKEAAEAMQDELMRNNQRGHLVTIQFSNVWSEIAQCVVSTNGYHCGIEYTGRVYCNIHPFGLPLEAWIEDFLGFGERVVLMFPF